MLPLQGQKTSRTIVTKIKTDIIATRWTFSNHKPSNSTDRTQPKNIRSPLELLFLGTETRRYGGRYVVNRSISTRNTPNFDLKDSRCRARPLAADQKGRRPGYNPQRTLEMGQSSLAVPNIGRVADKSPFVIDSGELLE